MRGVLFRGNRQAIVRDFPDPEPGPRQVVVKMRVAAVCGSDLHGYRRTPEALGNQVNVIPGHEPCGDVVALGSEVRNVKVGDRVVVYHYLGCGHCKYCLSGYMQLCPQRKGYGGPIHGSDADLLLTNEVNCLPLLPELSYVDGAFIACQASTAYSAMLKLNPSGRDTLAVFGLGPVGLCGVLMAKAFGARVVGIDTVEERLELASKFGADEVVNGGADDVVSQLKALTCGDGPSLAFEASGNPTAHQNLLGALGNFGKAAFVGTGPIGKTIGIPEILTKQLTLMTSFVYPIHMYYDLAPFIVRHKLPFDAMVTHRFGIEDAPEAFRLADSARTGKVVLEWT